MPSGFYVRTLTPLEDRLFKQVRKNQITGCWEWTGSMGHAGHGQIAQGGFGKEGKRLVQTHRASWELKKGPIPPGLCVLHKCDVPACVNPDHLFLGTKADNSADMKAKNRQKRGTQLPQSKLTPAKVRKIRNSQKTQKDLAKLFGISQASISNIKNRLSWTHL